MNEIEKLKKDKKKAESKGNWKEYAEICNYLGQIYSKNGDHEASLAEHKLEKTICNSVKDDLGIAIAHRKIGECYCELQSFSRALAHHGKYLKLAQKLDNKVEEQRAWATIGRTYHMNHQKEIGESGESDSALKYLNNSEKAYLKALNMCDRLKNEISPKGFMEMRGRLLLNLGLIYGDRGNLEQCIDFIEKSVFITEKYDLLEDLHRCQYSLAEIYQKNGKKTESLRYIDQALSTSRKLKDKILICEALFNKADLLISLGDFYGAKTYLRKAYKLRSPVLEDRLKTEEKLCVVYRLYELETELLGSSKKSGEELMALYEKLGDGCAHVSNFSLAFTYYQKMLDESEKLNKPLREKAIIYSSLAVTCMDMNKFIDAFKYFKLELECYGEKAENRAKTLMNLAQCARNLDKPTKEILGYCEDAYQILDCCSNAKQKYQCLESLLLCYHELNDKDKACKIENQIAECDYVESDDETENEKFSQDTFHGATLSEISDGSDSDDDEEVTKTSSNSVRLKRHRTTVKKKVNEVGESPLHRACINGNLKAVKLLLNQKHPVNVRDYSGWLPIHEAANHGYLEILEELICHGASINDRGGQLCQGITPLHDAASCGHLDIMNALIRHGASVSALNDAGESPLECLIKRRKKVQADLDEETLNDCLDLENKMKEMMNKIGQSVLCPEIHSNSSSDHDEHQSDDDFHGKLKCNDDDDNDHLTSGISSPAKLFAYQEKSRVNNSDISKSATKMYENAILTVGRSANRPSISTNLPSSSSNQKISALLEEHELVNDDWLIKDVKDSKHRVNYGPSKMSLTREKNWQIEDETKTKHKRGNYGLSMCSSTEKEFNESASNSSEQNTKRENKRKRPIDMSVSKRNSSRLDDKLEGHSSNYHESSSVNSGTSSKIAENRPAEKIVRVKVKICEKLLLIPIPNIDEKRVSWLCNEASNRYFEMTGLRPIVSLTTKDGAALSREDLLIYLVSSDDELTCVIDSWDLPPLPERYKTACKVLGTFAYGNITMLLNKCQSSQELILNDMSLGLNNLRPIFRSIQHQNYLTNLSLSCNKLQDDGFQLLLSTLPTLPSLIILNLSNNNLTFRSMQSFANFVQDASYDQPLQLLKTLDLSANPLTDFSSSCLGRIISGLSSLENMNLSSCQLTSKAFQHSLEILNKSLSGTKSLTSLSFRDNDLSDNGFDLLLKSLNCRLIISLDLSSCNPSKHGSHLCHSLGKYLSQTGSCLKQLSLAECNLNNEDISSLSSEIKHARKLSHLSLAGNENVNYDSILKLLKDIKSSEIPLHMLDLSGCLAFTSCLNSNCLESIDGQVAVFSELLNENRTLKELYMSIDGRSPRLSSALQQTWINHWGDKAVCKVGPGNLLQFSVH